MLSARLTQEISLCGLISVSFLHESEFLTIYLFVTVAFSPVSSVISCAALISVQDFQILSRCRLKKNKKQNKGRVFVLVMPWKRKYVLEQNIISFLF
jgi:hypothetical protein